MSARPLRKFPTERRSWPVAFAHKLAVGETLLPGASAVPDDPAVTATVLSVTDTAVTVRVSGGLVGQIYAVAVRVGTSHSNTLQEDLVVEVSSDSN